MQRILKTINEIRLARFTTVWRFLMNESVILECPGNTGKKCVGGNGDANPSAGALIAAAGSGPIPVGLRRQPFILSIYSQGVVGMCWGPLSFSWGPG